MGVPVVHHADPRQVTIGDLTTRAGLASSGAGRGTGHD